MKKYLVIMLMTFLIQNNVGAQDSLKMVKEIIEKRNKEMEDAFNNDDMAKVAAFYTDDAEITADNYNVKGRERIDKYWGNLKGKGRGWKLSVFEIGGRGEYMYQLGTSDLKYISREKETRAVTNFILIWKLDKDNQYKIFRDYLTDTKFKKD